MTIYGAPASTDSSIQGWAPLHDTAVRTPPGRFSGILRAPPLNCGTRNRQKAACGGSSLTRCESRSGMNVEKKPRAICTNELFTRLATPRTTKCRTVLYLCGRGRTRSMPSSAGAHLPVDYLRRRPLATAHRVSTSMPSRSAATESGFQATVQDVSPARSAGQKVLPSRDVEPSPTCSRVRGTSEAEPPPAQGLLGGLRRSFADVPRPGRETGAARSLLQTDRLKRRVGSNLARGTLRAAHGRLTTPLPQP
jgi:hypothetical protein